MHMKVMLNTCGVELLQAAQVRKHSYKAENSLAAAKYHPDTHQTCTIFAGTVVHQVLAIT